MKVSFLLAAFLIILQSIHAQVMLNGIVLESESNKPIAGAQVIITGSNNGTMTLSDGSFSLRILQLPAEIDVRFLGYERNKRVITVPPTETLTIILKPVSLELSEINVQYDIARERHSPVSFTKFSQSLIESELGDRPLPEIMQSTPGLYAARDGGGSGDATVSIRGFQQENIAVLLNGVPINGAENGLVYWNNWIGLTDATSSVQVQRGIGASRVALNSVGGTINIITRNHSPEKAFSFSHRVTSYGNRKTIFGYQSGLMENGWSVQLMGSRTTGDGYVDATYVDAWAYFVNIEKRINPHQTIQLIALGGPERHGQRNLKLSWHEIDRFGYTFNKDWGAYNGKINNASENFYHKPHIALNHYWQINKSSMLSTSAYYTPGYGGGKWQDSFQYGPGLFDFRNPSGQIDWNSIYAYNNTNSDEFQLANGEKVSGYSKLVQTHFLASHVWTGLMSTYEKELAQGTRLIAGVHYRYFRSVLQQKVTDLLGGDFYIDDYAWSLAGIAGRDQIKMPGDIIRINNGGILHNSSLFVQVEKNIGRLSAFAGGTLTDARYRRYDPYNYPVEPYSEWVTKFGADVKAGINFNLDEHSNFYGNAGYFSKTPYYKYVFGNFNNVPVRDQQNEQVFTTELGYGFRSSRIDVLINGYYTLWKDVSFLSNEYVQLENNTQSRAMVSGLDALHKGFEAEATLRITPNFYFGALISAGNWKWRNDVHARLLNDLDVVVDTINVYTKGLRVGGHPQLQAGLSAGMKLLENIDLSAEWHYFDRHYASFDPIRRQDENNRRQSYRLPSAQHLNLHFQLTTELLNTNTRFFVSCFNLLDQHYILKGEDGNGHDRETFRGFWSFGRTFSAGMKVTF